MKAICGKCHEEHERNGQRYCLKCHASYMREWRKTHPLTPEQRRKDISRSYANVYKHRGKLIPENCSCGEEKTEMHHSDYSQPLLVEWMCRSCHLLFHNEQFEAAA